MNGNSAPKKRIVSKGLIDKDGIDSVSGCDLVTEVENPKKCLENGIETLLCKISGVGQIEEKDLLV